MNRYRHKIVILKHNNEHNPYKDDEYEEVFSGKCNCVPLRMPTVPATGVGVKEFRAIIPKKEAEMPEIGENYRVLVSLETGKQEDRDYDYVGYVTDFRRYVRNCEVFFQMSKDNVIEEETEV